MKVYEIPWSSLEEVTDTSCVPPFYVSWKVGNSKNQSDRNINYEVQNNIMWLRFGESFIKIASCGLIGVTDTRCVPVVIYEFVCIAESMLFHGKPQTSVGSKY